MEDAYIEHTTAHGTERDSCSNALVNVKQELGVIETQISVEGAALENPCSVFIEDPIMVAMKEEEEVGEWLPDAEDELVRTENSEMDEIRGEDGCDAMDENDDGSSHSGKALACDICGATFVFESNLKKHVDRHGAYLFNW